MTLRTLPPVATGTGVPDPECILQRLDELMARPGAQSYHYLVARHLLTSSRSLVEHSLQELQDLTGRSATTCKGIRHFLADFEGQDSDRGQDSAPCTHDISTCVQQVQYNMHGAESRCVEQLKAIGWGRKKSQQVQDPVELMRNHGVDRVRQAINKAMEPSVKNPAGFITWYLRNQPLEGESVGPPVGPPQPTQSQDDTSTDDDLRPMLGWIQGKVRPKTWQAWFEDCRLIRCETGITVRLPNSYATQWVETEFSALFQTAANETIGPGLQIRFEP